MRDEELLVRKKELSALLVHRMNRHFYPLACRSFSHEALSIDQAFAREADALSAKERSKVLKKYVHFRLALAEMFLTAEAKSSPFLSLTLTEKLSLDVTGQFSKAFERVRDGLSYFSSSFEQPEAAVLPLVSLLAKETGLSLSPYMDFFTKETLPYIQVMRRDGKEFLGALTLCGPDYAGREEKAAAAFSLSGTGRDGGAVLCAADLGECADAGDIGEVSHAAVSAAGCGARAVSVSIPAFPCTCLCVLCFLSLAGAGHASAHPAGRAHVARDHALGASDGNAGVAF